MKRLGLLYDLYERRLVKRLQGRSLPAHVGVMLDGNRRWARMAGLDTAQGHQAGAERIADLLTWCEEFDVEVVTLWMLSTDNLHREQREIKDLLRIIADAVDDLSRSRRWRLQMVGDLALLPESMSQRLRKAEEHTKDIAGMHINIAVGYGGRHEIVGAVRNLITEGIAQGVKPEELPDLVSVESIASHLYTKGQPDPDLVIRTSGEQRLGGFLLWQSAHSEFYFCEAFWPDFRRVDFLRALRSYSERERRLGR